MSGCFRIDCGQGTVKKYRWLLKVKLWDVLKLKYRFTSCQQSYFYANQLCDYSHSLLWFKRVWKARIQRSIILKSRFDFWVALCIIIMRSLTIISERPQVCSFVHFYVIYNQKNISINYRLTSLSSTHCCYSTTPWCFIMTPVSLGIVCSAPSSWRSPIKVLTVIDI